MKPFLFALLLLLTGCSGGSKKASPETTKLTFNSFEMLLPIDTVRHRLPTQPFRQTDDRLTYHDVMAEGVRWDEVIYYFTEGQLVRATATRSGRDIAGYRQLFRHLTGQYGKPTQNLDSLTIWARRDAEISLQPGTILFARR